MLDIKDLKDLSIFHVRGYYRHAGPNGPEEMFFTGMIAGDRPPRYDEKNVPLTVGRGPVPRRASIGKTAFVGVRFSRGSNDRGGQAPALRARKGVRLTMRCSGSGDPELQFPASNFAILANPAHLL